MGKSFNPFKMTGTYITGFIFVTIFFIMFFSSQITQDRIGVIDPSGLAKEILEDFDNSCIETIRCDTRDPPQNIPEAEFRESCRTACVNLVKEVGDTIDERINEGTNQRIGFFTGLFFNPSATMLGLIVIILFVIGFIFGWGIGSVRRSMQ